MAQPRGDIQLALGYWIVSHRDQLRKWWVLALLGFIAASLTWATIFFVVFSGQHRQTDIQVGKRMTGISALQASPEISPRALEVKDVQAISRGVDRVDLVGTLVNPNQDWGASQVTVHFSLGDQAQETQTVFVNPGTQRPVIRLNVLAPAGTDRQASLSIEHTDWVRASAARLPPPEFSAEKMTIRSTSVAVGGQSFLTVNLQADVTNRSVYNFVQVTVPILLRSGTSLVAVDELRLDRWPTLTAKSINHTWSYPVSQTSAAEILPQVNQFDPDNLYR